jgi:hypothetical protein
MPKREKPFHLDLPFDEALRRYAQADPSEVAEQEKKATKRRQTARTKKRRSSLIPLSMEGLPRDS